MGMISTRDIAFLRALLMGPETLFRHNGETEKR
jgi:hypothetical protein